MRVPLSWLREYVNPGMDARELADLLSMRAVDVDRVTRVGVPSAEGFVIGKVLSAEKHPNADRLTVTEVDTGDGTRTIVCGAPNVAAGQTVPVGLPGAVMPGGMELGQAKLRGVVSDGMILSETELEVGEDSDGIIAFAEEHRPGTPLAEVLPIADDVLELDLNPNRVDLFGVYGVAREVHAITGAELAPPPWSEDAEPGGDTPADQLASITVEVPDLCPRFTARVFTGVQMGPSPLWLKQRLIAAGQRPISNVVDITNYVMLLTAQPIHAYDLDKVPGGELIVRTARDGEEITTLDGVARKVDDRDGADLRPRRAIGRHRRDHGRAGLGGLRGDHPRPARGRQLGRLNILRTSRASWGYARRPRPGSRSSFTRRRRCGPSAVTSRLLVELAGAAMAPGTIDEAGRDPGPTRRLPPRRAAGLAAGRRGPARARGRAPGGARVRRRAQSATRTSSATVPLHRHYDVTREADLIEEVGRLEGFDRLPRTLPAAPGAGRAADPRAASPPPRRGRARRTSASTRSSPGASARPSSPTCCGSPATTRAGPRSMTGNPLSEDQSAMRTTLLGGLLDAARHNLARGAERVGAVRVRSRLPARARPTEGGPLAGHFRGEMAAPAREPHRLAALAVGPLRGPAWSGEEPAEGFYALKGALEALFERLAVTAAFTPAEQPFLHPGRVAAIAFGGAEAGWLGELHPQVAAQWDLPGGAAFELDLAPLVDCLERGSSSRFEDVTSFPAVLQDLAVVVEENVPAEAVRAAVFAGGGELLEAARIFDLYRGDQVGEGRKSLAMRLEFRSPERTLTDEEVAGRSEAIKAEVEALGGSLRE